MEEIKKPYPWRCFKCGQLMVMPTTIEYKAKCRQGNKLACFTIPALPIDECSGCRQQYFSGPADDMITDFLQNPSIPKEYEDYVCDDPRWAGVAPVTQEQVRKTYRVYQDGKPADTEGYPSLHHTWSPQTNTHLSIEEAIRYANAYAYPLNTNELDQLMKNKTYIPMELNVPVDMSMGEDPVMMEIRKLE